jgi:hypothetical protein
LLARILYSLSCIQESGGALSGDQQQGLHTLVRSYLAALLHPTVRPSLGRQKNIISSFLNNVWTRSYKLTKKK